ncbi:MAG: Arm DNA-binding domain-containing protein [Bacteroidota bacterium]
MTNELFIATYLKVDKVKVDGTALIYMRLGLNGFKKTFTPGLYAIPGRWDATKQFKVTRTGEEQQIKVKLDEVREKVITIHKNETEQGRLISAEQFVELYLNPCSIKQSSYKKPEFYPYPEVPAKAVDEAQQIIAASGHDTGSVEYLETKDGRRVFYDINANSNLRPSIGIKFGKEPFYEVARYLKQKSKSASN